MKSIYTTQLYLQIHNILEYIDMIMSFNFTFVTKCSPLTEDQPQGNCTDSDKNIVVTILNKMYSMQMWHM
jgi:hypothetical protein